METRNLRALTGLVAVIGLLVGCAPAERKVTSVPAATAAPAGITPTPVPEKPKFGGILKWGASRLPARFDILTDATATGRIPMLPMYDQLVEEDRSDPAKLAPHLLEGWQISDDGRLLTLRVRKGVKFHDGALMTAQYVKFFLDVSTKLPEKGAPAYAYGLLSPQLRRTEAPDEYTVKVFFDYPRPSFLPSLAGGQAAVISKAAYERPDGLGGQPVGTGPFKYKLVKSGVSLDLVRNPDYFIKDLPYLDGISVYAIPDAGTMRAAFAVGQVDILPLTPGVPRQALPSLKQQRPGIGTVVGGPSVGSISFNWPHLAGTPFKDVRVRKAVALAVDRENLSKLLLGEWFAPQAALFPDGSKWLPSEEDLKQLPGYYVRRDKEEDRREARRLLAEAGFKDGFQTTLMTQTIQAHADASVVLKAQLKEVGIDVEIKRLEAAAFHNVRVGGDWALAFGTLAYIVDDPDSVLYSGYVKGGGQNWAMYDNPRAGQLIDKQSRILDPLQRKKALQDVIQTILAEDVPVITVGTWMKLFAWREYVKGWGAPQRSYYSGYSFRDVWLAR
ncbi:MAG: ABC transporter substrate-binding protein [Chloroflexi bacterium]|nr:ABC transporter substrate-binding protein [Chloroflexota bacterium]